MSAEAARRFDSDSQGETPECFLDKIHEALNAASLRGALEWAEKGLKRFPQHSELQRLHRLLRPGKVRVVLGFRIPDPQPSYEWLQKNWDRYRGRWVAVSVGELVAESDNLADLLRIVREKNPQELPILHFIED